MFYADVFIRVAFTYLLWIVVLFYVFFVSKSSSRFQVRFLNRLVALFVHTIPKSHIVTFVLFLQGLKAIDRIHWFLKHL